MKEYPDNVTMFRPRRAAPKEAEKPSLSARERLARALSEALPMDQDGADPCASCEHVPPAQSVIIGDGNIQIGGSRLRQIIQGNGNVQIAV